MSALDACDPGAVTPVCTEVAWYPPDPEIGNPWFPVPIGTWEGDDGLQWPPHTPGTWAPGDVETEYAR